MCGTRIEREVEIYAANLGNKTKCMSVNTWRKRKFVSYNGRAMEEVLNPTSKQV
jgi:hypothetical protein